MKKGQAVIIVLLVLVVVLTIGLSVATNTVRDIKISQQTELSNRAFNAAEAGIEAALSGQGAGTVTIGTGADAVTYNVSITTQGGVSGEAFVFNKPVAKDDTQQIWFVGHADNNLNLSDELNFNSRNLIVYWGNDEQSDADDFTPAIEISIIYSESGTFKMAKGVYDPNTNRAAINNFSQLTSTEKDGNFVPPNNIRFKKDLDLAQAPFSIPAGAVLYAARLRLLYNSAPQLLGAGPATNTDDTFPVQGRLISSTGTASNVNRKVEVFESYPALPPIFDYVIFNGSNNSLQK